MKLTSRGVFVAEVFLALVIAMMASVTVTLAAPGPDPSQDDSSTVADSGHPVAAPSDEEEGPSKPVQPAGDGGKLRREDIRSSGKLETIAGSRAPSGPGEVQRFSIEVEEGLPIAHSTFSAIVEEVIYSPRGWAHGGEIAFERVDSGPVSFTVTLASPDTTDELCAPLQTNGIYSCHQRNRAVLNYWRWMTGADAYGKDLDNYRIYMINHEVGHALGEPHRFCPSEGEPAPLMMQQTKGVGPCEPNPWPLPEERA